MKTINTLPPFKRFCVTIGNLPSSYVDSMSYYECIMWLCKYLKDTVIPAINENAEAVNELINWFNNLDVQEEINNKLDDMAESGELQEIIASYLNVNAILVYGTKSDMKNADNIINGSICKTLGITNYLDGDGSLYKIRTITSSDTVDEDNIVALTISDTLIAEKIPYSNNKELLYTKYKKLVIVGDSYGEQNSDSNITKFYYETFRDNLGLTDNVDFFYGFQSGGGFGNGAYLSKLISAISNVSDKKTITDILVCGGWNDSDKSQSYGTDEAFNAGILAFNNYVKQNLPNAKVTIAHISWGDPHITHTNAIFQQMPVSIERYKEACNKYGWTYLTGAENILHYYNESFWQSDGNHPSQSGQTLLGNELARAFVSGSTNIYRLHSGSIAGSGTGEYTNFDTIYSILNDNMCELFTPKTNVGIYFKINDNYNSYNCDGAHEYEIGAFHSLEVVGYSPFVLTNVPCYFTGTFGGTNSTYMGYTDIFLNDNKISIRPTLFINGNRAESFTCNYVWLPNLKISAPSIYC